MCPLGWTETSRHTCAPPETYLGFCDELVLGAINRFSSSGERELQEIARDCRVEWPCITHSGWNLRSSAYATSVCPDGWTPVYVKSGRALCMAPDENRRCGVLLEPTNMTALEKSRWARDCEEEWGIDATSLQQRLKEYHRMNNESKFVPLVVPTQRYPGPEEESRGPFSYVNGTLVESGN
eukprot:Protomagalhaensia_sp_Gyna_25__2722@NODE_2562_length_1014_cov_3_860513_g2127_i0_p1_GENE_NODE_2562_length_1014_cov_3_860513_g2127_i0NODE_2562_length_1014_cov_3_860513_g2127_i0_p1_ORF_typecomplete_len181_score11_11CPW_WPC/PF09717_10/5_5e11CPW_WPC/PF09717_10/3e07MbtH/PF03621_13/4_5e02MbtH/PF03621_13/0_21_NODE_2562_length_1014_cov_3_860513_g2127_i0364906